VSHSTRPMFLRSGGRKAKPARVPRSVRRVSRAALIERRDHSIELLARLHVAPGEPGVLFDKARRLLTRHWSESSWRLRVDILRTAEWLIGVGSRYAKAEPVEMAAVDKTR
jgi:hypothetical protein